MISGLLQLFLRRLHWIAGKLDLLALVSSLRFDEDSGDSLDNRWWLSISHSLRPQWLNVYPPPPSIKRELQLTVSKNSAQTHQQGEWIEEGARKVNEWVGVATQMAIYLYCLIDAQFELQLRLLASTSSTSSAHSEWWILEVLRVYICSCRPGWAGGCAGRVCVECANESMNIARAGADDEERPGGQGNFLKTIAVFNSQSKRHRDL